MKLNSRVMILMATYNGRKYIEQQINSLLMQTYTNFLIVIRDDGSSDGTKEFVSNLDDPRIFVLEKKIKNKSGHKSNFFSLAQFALDNNEEHQCDYYMFCDQDDVWLPDKIENSLRTIASIKSNSLMNSEDPLLVHSDLEVVDEYLNTINESFFYSNRLCKPENLTKRGILYRNNATGCTIMFNTALLRMSLPINSNIAIHDWWFVLVAFYTGRVGFLNKATVKYRQHDNNAVGASLKSNSFRSFYYDLRNSPKGLARAYMQAKVLQERLGVGYSIELDDFVNSINLSLINRIKLALKPARRDTTIKSKLYMVYRFVFLPFYL